MRKKNLITLFFSFLLLASPFFLNGCTSKPSGSSRPVSMGEAQGLLNNQFAVLVVLDSDLSAKDSLSLSGTSHHVPLKDHASWKADLEKLAIPKETMLLLVSNEEQKLQTAAQVAQKAGYSVGFLSEN